MAKAEELLAVLDLPEDSPERYGWLLSTIREHEACCPADLAFRLRDEVCHISYTIETTFCRALDEIEAHCNTTDQDSLCWWLLYAQPIHWIAAALIAKEEANDG